MKLPLVIGVAATSGVAVGLALGAFLLGWGLVGACAVTSVVFAYGLARDPGDLGLRAALVALSTFVGGFSIATVWSTLDALDRLDPRFSSVLLEPLEVETAAQARDILLWRWIALGIVACAAAAAAWRWRSEEKPRA